MSPGAFLRDDIETPRTPRKVPPYPGFDLEGEDDDDLPVPRVKQEAEESFIKSRGSVDTWAFHGCTRESSPPPDPRCPTRESKSNWTHGKYGTVKPMLNGTASPRPHTAPPRVKPEAEGTAHVSKGGRMCRLLTKYGESGATPRVARVKPEAEDTAEVHKGGRMNKLIHSYGKLPVSARAVPRVKVEGEDNADLDKGKRMDKLVHNFKLPGSARNPPRVKPEAEENAELDKGKRMKRMIHKYGRMPLSARAVPRVKTEGDPNYTLDMGGRMNRLVHSCHTLPKSPRDPPRVKHVEAKNTYHRARGSMGKLFRDMGNRTCAFTPGVQRKAYLRTSMM